MSVTFRRNDDAGVATEYALIVGLVAVILVGILSSLAPSMTAFAERSAPSGSPLPVPQRPAGSADPQVPELSVQLRVLSVTDANRSQTTDAGDTVEVVGIVGNSGVVALEDASISTNFGVDSCAEVALLMGDHTRCSTVEPYVLTAQDIEAGQVEFFADASAQTASRETVVAESARQVLHLPGVEALTLTMMRRPLVDVDGSLMDDLGDEAEVMASVTNDSGDAVNNVSVHSASLPKMTCSQDMLAPGESTYCVAAKSYRINRTDALLEDSSHHITAVGRLADATRVTSALTTVRWHGIEPSASREIKLVG